VSTMVPRCLRYFRQAVTVMQHSLLTTQGGEGEVRREGGGGNTSMPRVVQEPARALCICVPVSAVWEFAGPARAFIYNKH
jgi:hypothetical protein